MCRTIARAGKPVARLVPVEPNRCRCVVWGDPFDRILVAQALTLNATLVTVDQQITARPGLRTLAW